MIYNVSEEPQKVTKDEDMKYGICGCILIIVLLEVFLIINSIFFYLLITKGVK